jgi:ATP-dependent exoDNAse (exonuclease V) beta subunit
MTRAADYLVLSAGLGADRRTSSPWLELLSSCFNLDTGLPAVDPYLGRIALGDVKPDEIPEVRVVRGAPPAEKPKRSHEPELNRLAELVNKCEPTRLPETLARLEPDFSLRKTFSVSEIEAADTQSARKIETRQLELFADQVDSVDVVEPEDLPSTTDLGSIVHQVLERIDPLEPDAFDRWLEIALSRIEQSRRESLEAAAEIRLKSWAQSTIPGALAGAQRLFREVDFLLRWPTPANEGSDAVTIAGQIDCLYQAPDDRWHVLDYKTGRFEAGAAEIYAIQLTIYALATRELIGRLPDSIELVQLGERPQRAGFNLTPKVLSNVSDRINLAIARLRAGEVELPLQAGEPGDL